MLLRGEFIFSPSPQLPAEVLCLQQACALATEPADLAEFGLVLHGGSSSYRRAAWGVWSQGV